jgi:CheY-like chemotaxis protein
LIDLILPDASGYDIAKYFTDTLEQDEQPVMIALTGNTLESDKQKSLAAGMKYHLCKPVSVAELKKSIELSVNLRALIAQRWCRAAAQRIIAVVKKTTKPDKTCSRSRWQQRYRLLRD